MDIRSLYSSTVDTIIEKYPTFSFTQQGECYILTPPSDLTVGEFYKIADEAKDLDHRATLNRSSSDLDPTLNRSSRDLKSNYHFFKLTSGRNDITFDEYLNNSLLNTKSFKNLEIKRRDEIEDTISKLREELRGLL